MRILVLIGLCLALVVAGCGGSGYSSKELDAANNFIRETQCTQKPEELVTMAREALKDAGAKVTAENVRQVLEGAYRTDPKNALKQIPDIAKQVRGYEKGEVGGDQ